MLPIFFFFLQDGFLLEAQVGCSIREFLRDRCRIAPETIAERISTVFLDGKPVDDFDRAFIEDNSTLALSGAMPGLVGAVMRSNSPLRSFRSSITHGGDEGSKRLQDGLVRLKLFNTVMSELASGFLREGVLLEPLAVKGFLAKQSEDCRKGIREILLDREPIEMRLLLEEDHLSESELVSFAVWTLA
jgi:hypothetical protein